MKFGKKEISIKLIVPLSPKLLKTQQKFSTFCDSYKKIEQIPDTCFFFKFGGKMVKYIFWSFLCNFFLKYIHLLLMVLKTILILIGKQVQKNGKKYQTL